MEKEKTFLLTRLCEARQSQCIPNAFAAVKARNIFPIAGEKIRTMNANDIAIEGHFFCQSIRNDRNHIRQLLASVFLQGYAAAADMSELRKRCRVFRT